MPLVIAALLSARKCSFPSLLGRIDPHAGRAAAHQRGVGLQHLGHLVQFASQFDEQTVAFVGFEELVLVKDSPGGCASWITSSLRAERSNPSGCTPRPGLLLSVRASQRRTLGAEVGYQLDAGKSTPLAIASSLRMRSFRIGDARSRAAPRARRLRSRAGAARFPASRVLSASQSCQPSSMAAATTSSPIRVLAAISNSWLIVACLPILAGAICPAGSRSRPEQLGFPFLRGDAFEHLHPLAQFLTSRSSAGWPAARQASRCPWHRW